MKIHPQVIISGWRKARDCARQKLKDISRDNSKDETTFRNDLLNIAKTTLSSKLLTHDKDHFAKLAVDAVLRLRGTGNLEYIQVIKKLGGSIKESFLCDGLILEKSISIGSPKRLENCKVLAANTPMDYDKIKIYGTRVRADSIQKVQDIQEAEKEKMKEKVERIVSYGSNVFINRQLIYDYPEELLVEKGLLVIEHADFEGIERIGAALGAEICSTFDCPERGAEVMGHCDLIEEMMIGEDKVIKFSGCKRNEACTIVLRGASKHILDEAERSLHDALCVLVQTVKHHRVVYGGGNTEMQLSAALEGLAKSVEGKEALAIEGYARALRQIPTILADNGGYDSAELVQNLRVSIERGNVDFGLSLKEGTIESMDKLGVYECFRSKESSLMAASEAAEMIMRVDEIVTCPPRPRREPKLH